MGSMHETCGGACKGPSRWAIGGALGGHLLFGEMAYGGPLGGHVIWGDMLYGGTLGGHVEGHVIWGDMLRDMLRDTVMLRDMMKDEGR